MDSAKISHEDDIENGYYEETENYQRPAPYERRDPYRGSPNQGWAGKRGEPVHEGDEYYDNNRDVMIKRRQETVQATKLSYESWDIDRDFRPFTIFPRGWWRAAPPNHSTELQHPIDMVVLSYTLGRGCFNTYYCSRETKRIQNNHLQNGAIDIAHNFIIGGNGQVYEGRGWHSVPRLSYKLQRYSRNALFIGIHGNLGGLLPSEEVVRSVHDLIKFGVRKQFISPQFLEYSTKLWMLPRNPTDSEELIRLKEYL